MSISWLHRWTWRSLSWRPDIASGWRIIPVRTEQEAHFLLSSDSDLIYKFRSLLTDDLYVTVSRMNDQEVVEHIALCMARGHLHLFEALPQTRSPIASQGGGGIRRTTTGSVQQPDNANGAGHRQRLAQSRPTTASRAQQQTNPVEKAVGTSGREALLAELRANGTKFDADSVIAVRRLPDGPIVFLEQGNNRAGLAHIVKAHGEDFVRAGIPMDRIPDAVMDALSTGKIVGYQGAGKGRPIYEMANGQRIAVTVGTNGFVVGANPAGRK